MSLSKRLAKCCVCPAPHAVVDQEEARRAAWARRWKGLVNDLVRATQRGPLSRNKHPQDVVFDCILHLYAHEDFDAVLRVLAETYDTAPTVVRFYLPQLANFLLRGNMPQAERLEALLLDKCEHSLHFAHRLYFFLSSYAPRAVYTSNLCGAGAGAGHALRAPLVRAVEVEGSFAASAMAHARFLAEMPIFTYGRGMASPSAAAAGGSPRLYASPAQGALAAGIRETRDLEQARGASVQSRPPGHMEAAARSALDRSNVPRVKSLTQGGPLPYTSPSSGAGGLRVGGEEPANSTSNGGSSYRPYPGEEGGRQGGDDAQASRPASPVAPAPTPNGGGSGANGPLATPQPPVQERRTSGAGNFAATLFANLAGSSSAKGLPAAAPSGSVALAAVERIRGHVGAMGAVADAVAASVASGIGGSGGLHVSLTKHASFVKRGEPGWGPENGGGGGGGALVVGAAVLHAHHHNGHHAGGVPAFPPSSSSGSSSGGDASNGAVAATLPSSTPSSTAAHPAPQLPRHADDLTAAGASGSSGTPAAASSAAAEGLTGALRRSPAGPGQGGLDPASRSHPLPALHHPSLDAAARRAAAHKAVLDALPAAPEDPQARLAAFHDTPAICAELTKLSYALMHLPPDTRNAALRASLASISQKYLPSRTAYVPIGNVHHRLLGIHPEHSFCFKTKERVPYMVVLEVVDYANSAGGPLDESDTEDDDETRDRARKLRTARRVAESRARRLRRAAGHTLRSHGSTGDTGPGGAGPGAAGAASAGAAGGDHPAAAAIAAMKEGMRDAADRMNEFGERVSELVAEKAEAVAEYMKRKVEEVRNRGRGRSGTAGGGEGGAGPSSQPPTPRHHRRKGGRSRGAAAGAVPLGAGVGLGLGGLQSPSGDSVASSAAAVATAAAAPTQRSTAPPSAGGAGAGGSDGGSSGGGEELDQGESDDSDYAGSSDNGGEHRGAGAAHGSAGAPPEQPQPHGPGTPDTGSAGPQAQSSRSLPQAAGSSSVEAPGGPLTVPDWGAPASASAPASAASSARGTPNGGSAAGRQGGAPGPTSRLSFSQRLAVGRSSALSGALSQPLVGAEEPSPARGDASPPPIGGAAPPPAPAPPAGGDSGGLQQPPPTYHRGSVSSDGGAGLLDRSSDPLFPRPPQSQPPLGGGAGGEGFPPSPGSGSSRPHTHKALRNFLKRGSAPRFRGGLERMGDGDEFSGGDDADAEGEEEPGSGAEEAPGGTGAGAGGTHHTRSPLFSADAAAARRPATPSGGGGGDIGQWGGHPTRRHGRGGQGSGAHRKAASAGGGAEEEAPATHGGLHVGEHRSAIGSTGRGFYFSGPPSNGSPASEGNSSSHSGLFPSGHITPTVVTEAAAAAAAPPPAIRSSSAAVALQLLHSTHASGPPSSSSASASLALSPLLEDAGGPGPSLQVPRAHGGTAGGTGLEGGSGPSPGSPFASVRGTYQAPQLLQPNGSPPAAPVRLQAAPPSLPAIPVALVAASAAGGEAAEEEAAGGAPPSSSASHRTRHRHPGLVPLRGVMAGASPRAPRNSPLGEGGDHGQPGAGPGGIGGSNRPQRDADRLVVDDDLDRELREGVPDFDDAVTDVDAIDEEGETVGQLTGVPGSSYPGQRGGGPRSTHTGRSSGTSAHGGSGGDDSSSDGGGTSTTGGRGQQRQRQLRPRPQGPAASYAAAAAGAGGFGSAPRLAPAEAVMLAAASSQARPLASSSVAAAHAAPGAGSPGARGREGAPSPAPGAPASPPSLTPALQAGAGVGGQQQHALAAAAAAGGAPGTWGGEAAQGHPYPIPPAGSPAAPAPGSPAAASPGTVSGSGDATASAPKPVSIVFAERWRDKEAKVALTSAFSHLPGWRLMPVIVKANDDLRQEQFVSQLLQQFAQIFRRARVPVWMRAYDILATEERGGIIQAVADTVSIDALKRGDAAFSTLNDWFERHFNFGSRGPERVKAARLNFVRSMAAYSVVCYLLNIKDRHNGNILIDRRGHVAHIDWGFLLSSSPGGNINFESAPFKLTAEFVAVMGGARSGMFQTYRKLCIKAFLAARKYRERIILQVEMMLSGNSDLSCFRGGPSAVISGLRARFHESGSERACATFVHGLIDSSLDNWRTRWYDTYQRLAQGVM